MSINDPGNRAAETGGLHLESMLRNSFLCGVLCADSEGNITVLSPVAEQILSGRKPGRAPARLPTPLLTLVREAGASGRPVLDRTMALTSGRTSSVLASALPMPPGRQEALLLLKDFSGIQPLEQNLQRLDRLAGAGRLAAGMAHEMKNALVALRTLVDLLLERNPGAELAETVRHEVDRMDALVAHLLKFAAPAAPAFSPVRLHQVLEYSLRLARHRVGGKLVAFQCDFCADPDLLHGDDRQLEQAFTNLLLNAIEAIATEGALRVSTDVVSAEAGSELREGASPKRLRVRISDTGMGIAAANLSRIFEPFFTTKQNGTGLGLAVTQRIVEEHRGAIRVESRPGKGTTFTVLLPLRA